MQVCATPQVLGRCAVARAQHVGGWAPECLGQKMGSEGARLAESERGVWFWWKRYGICTPRFNRKNELVLFRALILILPPNSGAQLILGSWVGARRPFHLSVFLAAPRMVLPQDPSTDYLEPRSLEGRLAVSVDELAACITSLGGDVDSATCADVLARPDYYDLGLVSSLPPKLECDILCLLNRQRELTLGRAHCVLPLPPVRVVLTLRFLCVAAGQD